MPDLTSSLKRADTLWGRSWTMGCSGSCERRGEGSAAGSAAPFLLLGGGSGAPAGAVDHQPGGVRLLQRTLDQAGRAGFGTVVGMALGVAGKLAIGIAMIGLFLAVRLF